MKKTLFKSMLFAFATVAGLSASANGYPVVTLPYTFNATHRVGDIDVDRDGHADFYVEFFAGTNNNCIITDVNSLNAPAGALSYVSFANKVLTEFVGAPASPNGGLQTSLPGTYYTSMLGSGFSINSSVSGDLTWRSSAPFFGILFTSPGLSGTYYTGTQSGYVGVQFYTGGQLHYGWLNVVIDPNGQFVTINSAGYQASAGLPAIAGLNDPFAVPVPIIASLLGLAAIGGGIFFKRRKKSVC